MSFILTLPKTSTETCKESGCTIDLGSSSVPKLLSASFAVQHEVNVRLRLPFLVLHPELGHCLLTPLILTTAVLLTAVYTDMAPHPSSADATSATDSTTGRPSARSVSAKEKNRRPCRPCRKVRHKCKGGTPCPRCIQRKIQDKCILVEERTWLPSGSQDPFVYELGQRTRKTTRTRKQTSTSSEISSSIPAVADSAVDAVQGQLPIFLDRPCYTSPINNQENLADPTMSPPESSSIHAQQDNLNITGLGNGSEIASEHSENFTVHDYMNPASAFITLLTSQSHTHGLWKVSARHQVFSEEQPGIMEDGSTFNSGQNVPPNSHIIASTRYVGGQSYIYNEPGNYEPQTCQNDTGQPPGNGFGDSDMSPMAEAGPSGWSAFMPETTTFLPTEEQLQKMIDLIAQYPEYPEYYGSLYQAGLAGSENQASHPSSSSFPN
ncbi:uncharacterized protein FOMMEDRAFT_151130 [Fomitiporia mediterranea MF3/22]|uniref:uncharacterized protein n=1 Tax=Fomitiporia mediterranea (strain MF3/22) TaxID=694068 RepID=UPI000440925B|nr:uncharacterized protein FOMMEDRAFT_151130 [Fomitiporia mediterranea MF3/22]EJD08349.1 hypothetical protein FOMMEDRAFT_151130 [Fomitiporia mediterranea MF3/22]